ncbi:MAG: hypothetical protein AB8I08_11765 [Sandaracinaceae bacterium]
MERGPYTYQRAGGPQSGVIHCHAGLDVDLLELGPFLSTTRRRDRVVRTHRAWHLIAEADLDVARSLRRSVRSPVLVNLVRDAKFENPVELPLPTLSAFENLEGLVLREPQPRGLEAVLEANLRWLSLHGFQRLEGVLSLPPGLRDLRIGGNTHAYRFEGGHDLEVLHLWPRIGVLPFEQLRDLPKLRALRVIGNGNRNLGRLEGTRIVDMHVGMTDPGPVWLPDLAHALPKLRVLRISGTFTQAIHPTLAWFGALEELDLRGATNLRLRVQDLEAAADSSLLRLRLPHPPDVTVPAGAERLFVDD